MVDIKKIAENLPKTIKVYLENAYLKELECIILGVYWEKKDRAYIVFDKTIFHPKGGGQDGDEGFIEYKNFKFDVFKVIEIDGIVFHYVKFIDGDKSSVNLGLIVKCILDWDKRYKTMRIHTAGHVLDYAIGKVYGKLIETLSANHGFSNAYIEYKAEIPSENKINMIIEEANRIVREERRVKCIWVSLKDLSKFVFNAPNIDRIPKTDLYRIVIIEGVNGIPCTGTHVLSTGEIGEIKIVDVENTDRGFKLYYDVV